MEISIQLRADDLTILKHQLSRLAFNEKFSDADRRALKHILDDERCSIETLPLLERAMNHGADRRFRLHEFLERSQVAIPKLATPERSQELEARCQRLRAQQANREYKDMTRNVDAVTAKESPLSELGREIRAINRHLITLFNMLFTVVGSFVFAYFGTQYLYPSGPGAFIGRLGVGLVTATIVFFADLYFVVRSLDEEAYETDNCGINSFGGSVHM